MEFTEEYRRRDDKSEWGPGPWHDEPDKVVWVDEATGLDCMVARGPMGALCGYVGVPESHPMHGHGYDGLDVHVHGGLTYADGCQPSEDPAKGVCHIVREGRPDNVWWFGFDCAHAWDLVPGMNAFHRRMYAEAQVKGDTEGMRIWSHLDPEEQYRALPYVINEVTNLARQLAA